MGVTLRYPFTRSASDRTLNRQRQNHSFDRSFDSNNEAKSSSLSTINYARTVYPNQRTFVRLSTTLENHHDE